MNKAAFAALAALLSAPAALAATPDNPLARDRAVVSLDRLDLATVGGQQALAVRVNQAARAVCGDRVASIHLSLAEQSRACQAEVRADVRSRIEARTADAGHATGRAIQLARR
ncbi:UrcA family protein [uncultured Sphingomonas sp.]|uniref:UrcA family protein n=1 Tax=uncultured Sphingomonas sp. TaxID=158754 RepID=UPI0035CB04F9